MNYKIGIFGSAVKESPGAMEKARELGRVLAGYDNVSILTGACTGVPYAVAASARSHGMKEVWGYSSCIDLATLQKSFPEDDVSVYTKIFYSPPNFYELMLQDKRTVWENEQQVRHKYRNVILTANSDAGIVVSGRWGTLNEFTNLFDMGKIIGVLTATGGTADTLPELTQKISKASAAVVYFETDPKLLVETIIQELDRRKK